MFESNGYERLRCPVMLDKPVVCDNVNLPLGEYRFTISKRSGNIFLPSLIELASGRFFSGDENELRFLGKQIQLCSITIIPSSGEEQSVDIRPSFIDRLKFEGVEYVDSEEQECAIYTGTMYFIGPDGNRHEYSWKEGENRYHTQMYQVNPVRIVYINDSVLGITDLEGDGLYYVRLFDRALMQNIYQLTDRCPPPNSDPNSQRYDVGDLYAYTTIKERMPAYV